jgi:hypothetical protein
LTKRIVSRLKNILSLEPLSTDEIYGRLLDYESKVKDGVTKRWRNTPSFRTVTNILSSYFTKVGYDNNSRNSLWIYEGEEE